MKITLSDVFVSLLRRDQLEKERICCPFQEGLDEQKSKKAVTKVVSFVRNDGKYTKCI